MTLITSVSQRLQTRAPSLKSVQGITELSQAVDGKIEVKPPVGYVFRQGEQAKPDQNITGIVSQETAVVFGVVIQLLAENKTFGITPESADEQLEVVREEVKAALIGWQPEAKYDPVSFRGGRLVHSQNRMLWWQDDFQVTFDQRYPVENQT